MIREDSLDPMGARSAKTVMAKIVMAKIVMAKIVRAYGTGDVPWA